MRFVVARKNPGFSFEADSLSTYFLRSFGAEVFMTFAASAITKGIVVECEAGSWELRFGRFQFTVSRAHRAPQAAAA